jgi:hypothetical protein
MKLQGFKVLCTTGLLACSHCASKPIQEIPFSQVPGKVKAAVQSLKTQLNPDTAKLMHISNFNVKIPKNLIDEQTETVFSSKILTPGQQKFYNDLAKTAMSGNVPFKKLVDSQEVILPTSECVVKSKIYTHQNFYPFKPESVQPYLTNNFSTRDGKDYYVTCMVFGKPNPSYDSLIQNLKTK